MGYAKLIERLQALPQDKQAEVFDFIEFFPSVAARGKPIFAANGQVPNLPIWRWHKRCAAWKTTL